MRKNFGQLLTGAVLLFYGGVYLTARLLGEDIPFFFDGWWTLFLMVPALGKHGGNRDTYRECDCAGCWSIAAVLGKKLDPESEFPIGAGVGF